MRYTNSTADIILATSQIHNDQVTGQDINEIKKAKTRKAKVTVLVAGHTIGVTALLTGEIRKNARYRGNMEGYT